MITQWFKVFTEAGEHIGFVDTCGQFHRTVDLSGEEDDFLDFDQEDDEDVCDDDE